MNNRELSPQYKYVLTCGELATLCGITEDKIKENLEQNESLHIRGGKTGIPPFVVKKYLNKKGFDYSSHVVAVINMRGGIGKTTVSINTATRAKQYGFKTCIIDMDPQGSTTLAFDMTPEADDPIFYDIWQKPDEMVMGTIKKIDEDLYIIPSSLENGLLDASLINPSHQKNAVKDVCNVLKANGFDMIIIDNPPSLGTAVISSVCAADTIVVPMFSDAFSFKGLDITINEIHSICSTFNMKEPKVRILFSKYDRREKASETALLELKDGYSKYFIPFPIRTSTEFSKSLQRRETIFASYRKSTAKEDYDMYVKYILGLDKISKQNGENCE